MAKTTFDKFGNPCAIVGCKDNGKGYAVGYVTIKGDTYKIEPSNSKKDGVMAWVKITKLKPRPRDNTFGFGRNGGL